MDRTNPSISRKTGTTRNLGILASIFLIAACAEAPKEPSGELDIEQVKATLLASSCTTAGGNLTIDISSGEVGYVGRVAGCVAEPCVFVNATDASGNICRVNSTTATITVTNLAAAGAEKLVIDYSNGLFAQAATSTPPTSVVLNTGSTLMVIPPTSGGNMALGATGLDSNTLLARGTPRVDVSMRGVDFVFNGGVGKDTFTGDVGGWTTAPAGWATSANIASAVGAVSPLTMTINGGPNDDVLAGGSGINSLLGGAGNDTFVQSTTARAEDMQGGDGIDTVDYSVRSAAITVSVGKTAGVASVALVAAGTGYTVGDVITLVGAKVAPAVMTVATITGGGATGPIATVTLAPGGAGYAATAGQAVTGGTGTGATFTPTLQADDGAAGERDGVGADVEIVKGGGGNDILTAYGIITTDVVLIGNGGNDVITGGGGNDDLCGGAGDDRIVDNAGNDNIVGGAGFDTIDYTGASVAVTACLNPLDTVAGKPCVTTNGALGEKDVVNSTAVLKVCPRATLNVALGGVPTVTAVPLTSQGGAMANDVENLTGHATRANALYCGTLACTLMGGTGADTLAGGVSSDLIVGFGGSDVVTTGGGNDVVDLTHATGAAASPTVDCAGNAVTLLISAADVAGETDTNCSLANKP